MVPLPAVLGLSAEQTDNLVALIRESAQFLLALAAVIASFRSEKRARSAEASAAVAHERATEAAREQLTFALKRAVRDAKAQGLLLPVSTPPEEGGTL